MPPTMDEQERTHRFQDNSLLENSRCGQWQSSPQQERQQNPQRRKAAFPDAANGISLQVRRIAFRARRIIRRREVLLRQRSPKKRMAVFQVHCRLLRQLSPHSRPTVSQRKLCRSPYSNFSPHGALSKRQRAVRQKPTANNSCGLR